MRVMFGLASLYARSCALLPTTQTTALPPLVPFEVTMGEPE